MPSARPDGAEMAFGKRHSLRLSWTMKINHKATLNISEEVPFLATRCVEFVERRKQRKWQTFKKYCHLFKEEKQDSQKCKKRHFKPICSKQNFPRSFSKKYFRFKKEYLQEGYRLGGANKSCSLLSKNTANFKVRSCNNWKRLKKERTLKFAVIWTAMSRMCSHLLTYFLRIVRNICTIIETKFLIVD